MVKQLGRPFLLILLLLPFPVTVHAESTSMEGVIGKGEAMIVGITAEQAQHLALQRARADAIEQSAGIKILGSTLVKDGLLVGDFLKTFAQGFIVKEQARWDGGMIPQEKGPPLANYRVEITATVLAPQRSHEPGFSLKSELNRPAYVSGDRATLTSRVTRRSCLGIFNIQADDKIVMLFPRRGEPEEIEAGRLFRFPSKAEFLEMVPLDGHEMDTEAFMVVAVPVREGMPFSLHDFFVSDKPYSVPEFFEIYSRFADRALEKILPYEVRIKEVR